MTTRRVATGTTPAGRSFVASDEKIDPITVSALPGYSWQRLWGFDALPKNPADVAAGNRLTHFPPPGGVRFNLFTVPPSEDRPQLTPALQQELDEKLLGRTAHMESDQAGMHRTASTDLVVVLSGKISLELDDGGVVELSAGDTLVQNGTRHAWRNNTEEACTLAIVLIGTETPLQRS